MSHTAESEAEALKELRQYSAHCRLRMFQQVRRNLREHDHPLDIQPSGNQREKSQIERQATMTALDGVRKFIGTLYTRVRDKIA
ncbi:hypothetical protein BDP55DRAFT_684624 [Colletotrichum godetiae]|uniref:Uncharacterized protein n=1 Tax=Colletotrichum godetiae TaxID=1209918 RepID=A0AAJ0EQN3_9PEZI|nr:uncharacterized protein BDP55DRAFT_684624 [Colletotrichum godetiae]KAK1657754.1 hypothetical protein BDP55DRAFT_684624 [Colletotrichum godetiae]